MNKETTIKWGDLKEFSQLTIWKSCRDITKEKSYSGGIYAESSIIESVNNKQRQYTVPVSYYRDSTTIATSLHFEFMASKEGLINPNLIAGSQIKLISRNQVL